MGDSGQLLKRFFPGSTHELHIGGVPIREIASQYGTPLFVYDQGVVESQLQRLRAALPPRFDVYYSIKANPCRALLKVFLDHGCGLEVASGGEFHRARDAGCEPDRILFAGPGKTDSELEYCVSEGIGEIHAESLREVARLGAIASSLRRKVGVAVRVNPSEEAMGGAMQMGGKPSPFGVDEEVFEQVIDRVTEEPSLEFRGVHLFVGTQILDHKVLARQYRKGMAIAVRAARRAGCPIVTLDFGGGLGVPYHHGDAELDIEALGREVTSLVQERGESPELRSARFVLEPGRYLVGPSGVYVVRVVGVKTSRGKTYVVTDGGMHHHLAASGNLGQIIKRNFPVAVLSRLDGGKTMRGDVVGPLCTPLDVLARDIEFAEVQEGDLIGVLQSGAYARTASPLGFLSHPEPPEVLVERGRIRLVRERMGYDALLQGLLP